jgi:phage shock protein C
MTTVRLTRSLLNRVLGGVCGGIGGYLGISAWWVRITFIALALTTFPFAVFTYILLWFVMPGQSLADVPPVPGLGGSGAARYARPESMLILGAGAILVGILVLAQSTNVPQSDLLAPATLLLIGLALLVKQLRGRP